MEVKGLSPADPSCPIRVVVLIIIGPCLAYPGGRSVHAGTWEGSGGFPCPLVLSSPPQGTEENITQVTRLKSDI